MACWYSSSPRLSALRPTGRGRASGKLSIQITRRVTRKDGSFAGVVVVSIDPLYFSKFFDKVDLGQNGVVALGVGVGAL